MPFWALILLFIGTTVLSVLLQKRPKDIQPSGLGDFQVPTATAGRVIPVIFGTVMQRGPNVVWWGDLGVGKIKQSSGGIFGLFTSTTVVGYRYYLGMQLVLCHGDPDVAYTVIKGLQVGGKDVALFPPNGPGAIIEGDGHELFELTDPALLSLFGGDKKEGGIGGAMDFYHGSAGQTNNDYLTAQFGETAPSYAGLVYVVLEHMYCGTSPYIKDWAFLLERCPNQLGAVSGHHRIQAPMNDVFYSGIGTGTIGGLSIGSGGYTDTYALVATDATHFTVTGQTNGAIGTAVVGTPFTSAYLNFTITAGGTAFTAGDRFVVAFDGHYDANAACVIYDILTNVRWGLGRDPATINTASFLAVAEALFSEGAGISMNLDNDTAAEVFMLEVCRHHNLVLFTDPETGLWTLKAIRPDYDPATILSLTDDDMLAAPELSRPTFPDLVNEIKVEYLDRAANFQTRLRQAQDLAVRSQQGYTQTTTVQYHGFSNAPVAQIAAQRDLKTASYPLAMVQLKVNRRAYALRPGSPFKISWSAQGIAGMVLRVAEISYGTMADGKLEISIKAVEDIFSVGQSPYLTLINGTWSDPSGPPLPPAAQTLVEAPYEIVGAAPAIMDLCARADGTSLYYSIWRMGLVGGVTEVDKEELSTSGIFAPSGLLAADYGPLTPATDTVGFTIAVGGIDLSVLASTDDAGVALGLNVLYIEGYTPGGTSPGAELLGEFISWKTVHDNGDGTFTFSGLVRGIFDTLPIAHTAGTRVWFLSEGATLVPSEPGRQAVVGGVTVEDFYLRDLPVNGKGELPYASSTRSFREIDISAPRWALPYPPGAITVDGVLYPGSIVDPSTVAPVEVAGDLTLSWAWRDRVVQKGAGQVVAQDAASVTATPEETVTVQVYIAGALVRTVAAIATTSMVYTMAQRVADNADVTLPVWFRILPKRTDALLGTLTGTIRQTTSFLMISPLRGRSILSAHE